ncbi:hypothetical protein GCM10010404_81520 [Nonomuraea africana]|uniref:Uncharacterized protein n=1 Tax=Nonomuraea africana TaxID=46171 RepID=A0ABR9KX63_9ACTN|nr:hypothetical protein [Nonomuraea africana]MBE1566613.1 hypothetical protein [Nonomuraea africana]
MVRYQAIIDDERPGQRLVCNLCRADVEYKPCPDHVEFGTDLDWWAATGMCGQCGRDGRHCDGSCGCRCAHLHQPSPHPIPAIDGQLGLELLAT